MGILGLVRELAGRRVVIVPLATTATIKRARRLLG
jgi:RNase P/RNase MRP subunit POP5